MAAREIELKAMMIQALDGDATAYDALLRMLVPQLRTFFRRRVGGDDVAEDLVQETLIAVHTRRATFDRARPFTAWLYAIARYKLADHFRRSHRLAEVDEVDSDFEGPDIEGANSAFIDVERLLGLLPHKQSNVIRATKIEGLSLAEAASTAGISASDAKMSVYRGLKRLSARVQGRVR
jgi:RNA polymerase sigma factor (sigma-70 family)